MYVEHFIAGQRAQLFILHLPGGLPIDAKNVF